MTQDLNERLLAAHAASDQSALITLYTEAADCAPDQDAQGFYLTQAYIYALEAGSNATCHLRARLIRLGRESALPLVDGEPFVEMPRGMTEPR